MQAEHSIYPARSTPSISRAAIRSAMVHAAQSRLLLRRSAAEARDPHQARTLRDLAGVLQYVITAIEELRDPSELGATR